jgi:hypothetical protein
MQGQEREEQRLRAGSGGLLDPPHRLEASGASAQLALPPTAAAQGNTPMRATALDKWRRHFGLP